ncbi:hypothetical protein [Rhodopirellula sallentina]|uniref:Uncharacterized protein n=1 Tax=Rhodopirellula sallentina SM41 TaxID=1263870 RepID=M5U303_9BACT|nr:hypothetical protein [Rhodopirellula sallentina]EMI52221.1 hypothetical protein RSSM_06335 [Rhodopirellula sallentina SM41]
MSMGVRLTTSGRSYAGPVGDCDVSTLALEQREMDASFEEPAEWSRYDFLWAENELAKLERSLAVDGVDDSAAMVFRW